MNQLFSYLDYRRFLSDYFEEQKRMRPAFSHRYFAQKAGFRASNFMHLVMSGKRNMTKDSVAKVCEALRLKKLACEYFENLVFFNQATSLKDKSRYFDHLRAIQKRTVIRDIDSDHFEYYSNWIHPAVRELACVVKGRSPEQDIAERLHPSVSIPEVKRSLDLLVKLGFLVRQPDSTYRQSAALLSTAETVRSMAVTSYHIRAMALAAESIDRFRPQDRSITTLTLGCSREHYARIRERLWEFQEELLGLVADDPADTVCQVNFQLFPLTRMS